MLSLAMGSYVPISMASGELMWIIGTGLGMIMRVCESAVVLEVKGVGLVGLLAGRAEVLVISAEAAPASPARASVDTKSKTSFSFVDAS
jgi:hypothetical protein